MEAKVFNNKELNTFFNSIHELDKSVYSDIDVGSIDGMLGRFNPNIESYIYLEDNGELIGYLEFFPMSDDLKNRLMNPDVIYESIDDGVTIADMKEYGSHNDIFVLSTVIRKDYQGGEGIHHMLNCFYNYLKDKSDNGYSIDSINACTVSDQGKHVFKRIGLEFDHALSSYPDKWIMIVENPLVNNHFMEHTKK